MSTSSTLNPDNGRRALLDNNASRAMRNLACCATIAHSEDRLCK